MTVLIATSVVRGSRQGESHGGVYLLDVEQGRAAMAIDWNTADIDWRGRGWDRGLRGIAFDGDLVYLAASDELFVYTPDFEPVASYRAPFLKHCHEIFRYERRLFLTSTGYDSVLGFDLDKKDFLTRPFNDQIDLDAVLGSQEGEVPVQATIGCILDELEDHPVGPNVRSRVRRFASHSQAGMLGQTQ